MGLVYYHKNFIWGNRFKHYHHEKKWISFLLIYSAQFTGFLKKRERELKKIHTTNAEWVWAQSTLWTEDGCEQGCSHIAQLTRSEQSRLAGPAWPQSCLF